MPETFEDVLKIGVLGAGAFGTSMATVAARRGHNVVLWARDATQVQAMQTTKRNPKYGMQDFELPPNLIATNSLQEACQDADILILALPAGISTFCRRNAA